MKNTLLLSILFTFNIYSQTIDWEHSYGGSLGDYVFSVTELTDGSFIGVGYTRSDDGDITTNQGGKDAWAVKMSSTGNIIWSKTYGGSDDDVFISITPANDGGFILVGHTKSSNGDINSNYGLSDFWIVKIDDLGVIQWEKNYGGSNNDYLSNILKITDGYLLVGQSESSDNNLTNNYGIRDAWVLKIDNLGAIQWQKNYGGSERDSFVSAIPTSDGGYLFSGKSRSSDNDLNANFGNYDTWIVKTDINGVIQWQKNYGGTRDDWSVNTIEIAGNEYISIGTTESSSNDVSLNHGGSDIWLIKINSTGVLQWEKTYGTSDYDFGGGVSETNAGNFLFAADVGANNGDVSGSNGNSDIWVATIDDAGNILWSQAYGGSDYEYISGLLKTSDNKYLINAMSSSNGTGDVSNNYGSQDAWLFKINDALSIENNITSNFQVIPNPSNSLVSIQFDEKTVINHISVSNIFGQEVLNQKDNSFSVTQFEKGVYFVKIYTNKGVGIKKLIIN